MSAELQAQLAAYGEVLTAELVTLTLEDAMSTRTGKGNVRALEPLQPRPGHASRTRGILLAAAVFALVAAAGIAIAVALGTTREVADVPAPPFDTPEQAIVAFAAAMEESPEATAALFASNGVLHTGDRSQRIDSPYVLAMLRFRHEMGDSVSIETCTQDGPWARCTVTYREGFWAPTGFGPWEATWATTLSDDGHIAVFNESSVGEWNPAAEDHFVAFNQWLCEHHYDEAVARVWGSSPSSCTGRDWGFSDDQGDPAAILELHDEYLAGQ